MHRSQWREEAYDAVELTGGGGPPTGTGPPVSSILPSPAKPKRLASEQWIEDLLTLYLLGADPEPRRWPPRSDRPTQTPA